MGVLEKLGKMLAEFWLGLLGVVVLLSFPICGFIGSLAVGAGAATLVGGGTFGAVVFFVVAFFFGLFLSVFVWPHANDVARRSAEVLTEKLPK